MYTDEDTRDYDTSELTDDEAFEVNETDFTSQVPGATGHALRVLGLVGE